MKKIAWCTPFSAASSISEFSHTLIESHNVDLSLSAENEIDIFVNDNGPRYKSSSDCLGINEILRSPDSVRLFKKHYDHVFYNLGNNKENHQDIFQLSNLVPGVAILHDYVYQHYLAGRIFTDYQAPNVYAYLMGRHYGADGLKSVNASQIMKARDARIGLWDTDLTSRYPLIESIVKNPMHKGVVVHSEMGLCAIAEVYDGPILKIRLPGDEKESSSTAMISQWKEETTRKKRVTIGLIGHIQRGKQIHRLLEVVFESPELLGLIQNIVIAGKPSDKEYVEFLNRMISDNQCGHIVRLELNVSHERLQEIKEASDFFVNMRYPNTEGGSGSLIEQMACNKPVIVLNSGIFSEITAGVIKINNIDDRAALKNAIFDLSVSAELRIKLGDEARGYSHAYLAKDYIKEIIEFSESIKYRPSVTKQLELHEILRFDKETRGPEPLFIWDKDAFSEFANIQFQQYFEQEFILNIVEESKSDPIVAFERYSFAQTLVSIFDHAAKGAECKYWLFPKNPSLQDCYVIAFLKENHYLNLATIFAGTNVLLIKQWVIAASRFSAKNPVERFAVLQSICLGIRNEIPSHHEEKFLATVKKTISPKYFEIVRLVATLSYDEFARLLVGELRQFFDSEQYLEIYPDLVKNLKTDHDTLVSHYEIHGKTENRTARISSKNLILKTMEG